MSVIEANYNPSLQSGIGLHLWPKLDHLIHPEPKNFALSADKLHVITCISNPARFKSRWNLYERFRENMERAGVNLITVELAYGERQFEITSDTDPNHLQVRSRSVLWGKENLINLGISRLPHNWKYVAWIDADVEFQNPHWATETVERLQTAKVCQLFSHAMDMNHDHTPLGDIQTSFLYAWWQKLPAPVSGLYDNRQWHTGYGWAMRRDAYVDLGGLIDFAIAGSGDRHMAMSLIGKANLSYHKDIGVNYKQMVMAWQARCDEYIRQSVDYCPGTLLHYYHGKKVDRQYNSRWRILVEENYDPVLDIKRDWSQGGLIELTDRNPSLRNRLIHYSRTRNEDSIP